MSTTTLYRASRLALLLGAVLYIIVGGLSLVAQYLSPLWWVTASVGDSGEVLMLLGLPGIVARQASRAGWLGFVGFILLFLGTFLWDSHEILLHLALTPWLQAYAPQVQVPLYSSTNLAFTVLERVWSALLWVGSVGLGVATLRAGVFPKWAGLLLIASAVFALFGLVSSIAGNVAILFAYLGLGWMGYALWTSKEEALRQPVLTP